MVATPVVNSFNEWDPLEEVIVGTLGGGASIPLEMSHLAMVPREVLEQDGWLQAHLLQAGKPAKDVVEGYLDAQKDLEGFVKLLKSEGVKVRRPDPIDAARPYSTPDWSSISGSGQTVPRDVMIVIGNEIIESPMSLRSRYFEFIAYRRLLNEYFKAGAKWTAAPKPRMTNDLYDFAYRSGKGYVTTEAEPVFDAADIARAGKDLFVQRSHVTNDLGIEWLRRHLGSTYNVHKVEFRDERAVHIDATFVPLAPGKLLVNPDRPIHKMPPMFKKAGWEILTAPRTVWPKSKAYGFSWLHMNVLMLDEKRVIVEELEKPLIQAMKSWGFEPIPCAFRRFYAFGGSFHCATCDVRRRGTLQSYF